VDVATCEERPQCASQIRSIEMNFRGFVLAPAEGCADDAA